MNVRIATLLPIGSVVLLKDAEKRLMIYGVRQTEAETGQEYDYIGVLYPEGNMAEDIQFLFNHEDILEICFRGFEDQERADFLARLEAYYQENSPNG